MTGQSMNDFMSHHRCQTCFSPGHGKDPGVDRNLPSREGKGVHGFIVLDHDHFPLKLLRHLGIFRPLRRFDNPRRHPLDRFDLSGILRLPQFRIVLYLSIGLRAHLHFLRDGRHQQLRPARIGIRFTAADRCQTEPCSHQQHST